MTTTPSTPKTTKPRVIRTPQQKAQDRVDAAKARVERAGKASVEAGKRLKDAQDAKRLADNEEVAAQAAFEFESNHPDLPKASRGPSTEPATS